MQSPVFMHTLAKYVLMTKFLLKKKPVLKTATRLRWHLNILHVQSFRGAVCDTHHYLVVAKVREKLAVSKQAAQTFNGERFNIRKLNQLEVRKQYQIENSNRCAVLENLSDSKDINRAWENKEKFKISAKESVGPYALKQH